MRGSCVSEVSLIGCLSRKHFFGFFGLRGVWTQPLAPEEDAALYLPHSSCRSNLDLPVSFLTLRPALPSCSQVVTVRYTDIAWSALLSQAAFTCVNVSENQVLPEKESIALSSWGTGVRKLLLTIIVMPLPKQNKWCFTDPLRSIMNIHLTEEETARHTDNYPELSPSVLNEELDSLFVHVWRWLSHAAMQEACFQFETSRAYFIVP